MTTHRGIDLTLWLGLAGAAALAAACGGPGDGESTLERLQRRGVARVGYANEAPYAYFDNAGGRLTGEAVEIARVVLERIGVPRAEGVLTEFGSLIPGLAAGRFDLIAAGMYVTPERCRQIAFTRPTYGLGEAFVVEAGNPLDLHSYAAVAEHPAARLGVVAGAIELGYARAAGIPDDRILLFPDAPSAVEAVRAGRADAYGGTSLTVSDLLRKAGDSGLERAAPFTDPEVEGRRVRGYGAFGVRKEDRDLLRRLDEELAAFIGSSEHLELVRPFGFTAAELPGGVTSGELCAAPEKAS
jgi:polar amino acid transport system substrate-binding protein